MPIELGNVVHGFGEPSLDLYEQTREQSSHVILLSELAELWAGSDDRGDSNFDINLEDNYRSLRQGGFVHIACLNAALHPKYMI